MSYPLGSTTEVAVDQTRVEYSTSDVNFTDISSTTTPASHGPFLPDTTSKSDRNSGYYFEAAELGIPFALTAAIIVVLCVTVMYTKYRRARLRQNQQQRRNTHTIHGVPLCTAAYQRNMGISRSPAAQRTSSRPSEGPSNENAPPSYGGEVFSVPIQPPHYYAMQYYPVESPPKYEDIIKDVPGSEQGVQTAELDNTNFSLSEESTQTSTVYLNAGSDDVNTNPLNQHSDDSLPATSSNHNTSSSSCSQSRPANAPSPSHTSMAESRSGSDPASPGIINLSFEPTDDTSAIQTDAERSRAGARL